MNKLTYQERSALERLNCPGQPFEAHMKIATSDTIKIAAALAEVEGRSTANTIDAFHLATLAAYAEDRLEKLNIPKKHRSGTLFTYHAGGPTSTSYGHAQGATMIDLIRGSTEWFMIGCMRVQVWPKVPARRDLFLTVAQQKITHDAHAKTFRVQAPAAADHKSEVTE